MEIVFLIISVILTVLCIWVIGRLVFDTNKQLLNAYKTSEFLGTVHFLILIITILFATLCACNNTFWHLPYLTK
jgi:uncharacterized membrane protein YdjX (TVP38/TMEM64 family)